jgi:hypothetical protein
MDTVEGTGQDEIVVGTELLEARRKVAVVDEATGLVDDEQGEDDPVATMSAMFHSVPGSIMYLHGECAQLQQVKLKLKLKLSLSTINKEGALSARVEQRERELRPTTCQVQRPLAGLTMPSQS